MAVPFNATGLWPSANFGEAPKFCSAAAGRAAVPAADREVLCRLAARLAELAQRPQENEKKKLWYALNSLRPVRPLVLADPENGWNEIIPPASLVCRGELSRRWEMVLRKELAWGEQIRDDKPLEALFEVGYTYTDSEWGLEESYRGGQSGQSYAWEGSVRSPGDVDRIRTPVIEVDYRTTLQNLALAEEVFGGILRVGLRGVWWWSLGLSWDLARLVGLERMLYLLHDDPSLLHGVMARLRDGYLAKLDFLETGGLLSLNNNHAYVGSGGIGYTRELPQSPPGAAPVASRDLWCLTESQETIGVSPAQFEEFVFQYQLPLQRRFGLNCYGCCEPLDGRWDVVKRTPNLRRVSVSPWADQRRMAEALGDRYIFSRKPAPSLLAVPRLDEEAARRDIRGTLDCARGCVVELIMKDNHTLGGNAQNLFRWVRLAREEIDRSLGA